MKGRYGTEDPVSLSQRCRCRIDARKILCTAVQYCAPAQRFDNSLSVKLRDHFSPTPTGKLPDRRRGGGKKEAALSPFLHEPGATRSRVPPRRRQLRATGHRGVHLRNYPRNGDTGGVGTGVRREAGASRKTSPHRRGTESTCQRPSQGALSLPFAPRPASPSVCWKAAVPRLQERYLRER